MASKQAVKETTGAPKPVAIVENKLPVTNLDEEMRADAGMGVSTRAADNIVPSISVLQPLSPEVLDGPDQIANSKPGDFLMANAAQPLVDGKTGVWFQPCATTEWWFEFIPRDAGGGFVARYQVEYDEREQLIPPPGAEQDPSNAFRYFFPESNHSCIHYRFVAGFAWIDTLGLEYVIPFYGTGHTVCRMWNTKWTRKRFQNGLIKPAFSHLYHLTTGRRTNKKGTWFSIETSDGTPLGETAEIVGDPKHAYVMARALSQAFARHEKVESVVREDQEPADKEIPY